MHRVYAAYALQKNKMHPVLSSLYLPTLTYVGFLSFDVIFSFLTCQATLYTECTILIFIVTITNYIFVVRKDI